MDHALLGSSCKQPPVVSMLISRTSVWTHTMVAAVEMAVPTAVEMGVLYLIRTHLSIPPTYTPTCNVWTTSYDKLPVGIVIYTIKYVCESIHHSLVGQRTIMWTTL